MSWILIKDEEIPKDGKEYLVRNDLQGGQLSLIYWDKIHHTYRDKGDWVFLANIGTHWCKIPD